MASGQRESFDRAIQQWNVGDLTGYLDLYDEAIQLYGYSEVPMGKPEVRDFYRGIFEALADIELEIHEVVEDGFQLGCRFTMHGTHVGPMAGIEPTGRRVHQEGMTILRFGESGRVVERHSVADFGAVIRQLTE